MNDKQQTMISLYNLVNKKWKIFCTAFALICVPGNVMAEGNSSLNDIKMDIENLKNDNKEFKRQLADIRKEIRTLKKQNDKISQPRRQMSEKEYSELMKAIENKDKKAVESFMNKGFDLNISYNIDGYYEQVPLMRAVILEEIKIAELLIENGADINLKSDKTGTTILSQALEGKNKNLVELLLKNGADPKIPSGYFRETPLIQIMNEGYYGPDNEKNLSDITVLLLEYGADPNIKNEDGETALMCVIETMTRAKDKIEKFDRLKSLIRRNDSMQPILDLLYSGKHSRGTSDDYIKKNLRRLKEVDTDVNIQDKKGRTALMRAISSKYEEIENRLDLVKLLLSANKIDVNVQDEEGRTALDYAKQSEDNELIKLIEDAFKNKPVENSSTQADLDSDSDSDSDSD